MKRINVLTATRKAAAATRLFNRELSNRTITRGHAIGFDDSVLIKPLLYKRGINTPTRHQQIGETKLKRQFR